MELVLGVSMTPTRICLALVEGEKADGVIVDHDVFDIDATRGSATSRVTDDVIDTILGTHEGAIDAGHHLVSTGVTWTDRADAAALREALVARGVEDVLLVSELHAAAALAQAVGRAMDYDKTGLVFVERETATLAVVETADGSVVKVLSQTLHSGDAIAVVADMVTASNVQDSGAEGLFVVGSAVDVTAVNEHLQNLFRCPSWRRKNPNWRWHGVRRWRRPVRPATTHPPSAWPTHNFPTPPRPNRSWCADLLGYGRASDVADAASDPDEVPERKKPFLLVGSSLTAIFVAGILALTIAVAVTVRPTADQRSDARPAPPGAVALPPAAQSAQPPAAQVLPPPAPPVPPPARVAMAQLKNLPAPPPRAVVRDFAPAPAAPPPPPPRRRLTPPPPVIQLPVLPLPPILLPPNLPRPVHGPPFKVPKMPPAPRRQGARQRPSRRQDDRQSSTGHSPSSDVVSMMRPSATQAAP